MHQDQESVTLASSRLYYLVVADIRFKSLAGQFHAEVNEADRRPRIIRPQMATSFQ